MTLEGNEFCNCQALMLSIAARRAAIYDINVSHFCFGAWVRNRVSALHVICDAHTSTAQMEMSMINVEHLLSQVLSSGQGQEPHRVGSAHGNANSFLAHAGSFLGDKSAGYAGALGAGALAGDLRASSLALGVCAKLHQLPCRSARSPRSAGWLTRPIRATSRVAPSSPRVFATFCARISARRAQAPTRRLRTATGSDRRGCASLAQSDDSRGRGGWALRCP